MPELARREALEHEGRHVLRDAGREAIAFARREPRKEPAGQRKTAKAVRSRGAADEAEPEGDQKPSKPSRSRHPRGALARKRKPRSLTERSRSSCPERIRTDDGGPEREETLAVGPKDLAEGQRKKEARAALSSEPLELPVEDREKEEGQDHGTSQQQMASREDRREGDDDEDLPRSSPE